MVMVNSPGQMEGSMSESLTMTRNKAMASLRGTMGESMMVDGLKVNNMGERFIPVLKVKLKQENGYQAREFVG